MSKGIPRASFLLLGLAVACETVPIRPHSVLSSPQPEIDLPKRATRLALQIANEVPDSYVPTKCLDAQVAASSRDRETCPVHEWREELENGFVNGFGPFFELADVDAHPALTVQLLEATPTLSPEQIGERRYGKNLRTVYSEPSFTIRYRAHLVGRGNVIVRRSYGQVSSRPGLGLKSDRGALPSHGEGLVSRRTAAECAHARSGARIVAGRFLNATQRRSSSSPGRTK